MNGEWGLWKADWVDRHFFVEWLIMMMTRLKAGGRQAVGTQAGEPQGRAKPC